GPDLHAVRTLGPHSGRPHGHRRLAVDQRRRREGRLRLLPLPCERYLRKKDARQARRHQMTRTRRSLRQAPALATLLFVVLGASRAWASCAVPVNTIEGENCLPGNPATE